jgi:hypothetical protein
MFILGFNLVISISFVTCGIRFAYVDRHVDNLSIGHVSKLNGVNDKTDEKNQLIQTVET